MEKKSGALKSRLNNKKKLSLANGINQNMIVFL